MRIAILGLGRMGSAMARNLLELGHHVTVWNRTPERADALAGAGARRAGSVAEAVANAQVALSMVTDDAAEEALGFGPAGLLAHLPAGAIHLCMSSISPALSRRLADAHGQANQGYVAAPVLRGPAAAAARQLWILVAGPELQVNHCIGVLEALGRTITRVGSSPELAHGLRLGATALTGAMVEALSEALIYGEALGYPPAEYLRLLNTGLFGSPLMDAYGGMIVRHDYEPANQDLDLASKDIDLALAVASQARVPMPLTARVRQLLEEARDAGHGSRDLTILSRIRREEAHKASAPPVEPPPAAPVPPPPAPPPEPDPVPAPPPEPVPVPAPRPPEPEPAAAPQPPPPPPAPQPPSLPLAQEPEAARGPAEVPPSLAGPAPEPAALPVPAPMAGGMVPELAPGDLGRVSHFEESQRMIWAWIDGRIHRTAWRSFSEVELAMPHVMLLRTQGNLLLNPVAVLDIKPLFGGRARVQVRGGIELTLGRQASRDLRHVLGV